MAILCILLHANEAPVWPECVKIGWSAATVAHRGPLLGAGILQNADVAESMNVGPTGKILEAEQMVSGQAQTHTLLWAHSCHLL